MLRKKEERKDQRGRQTTFLDPFLSFILGRALHMTPSFFLLARRESFFYHSWTPLSFLQPSPLNDSIRGPQYLKTKEKAKTWIPD